ncbi:hypothetical protein SAMN04488109_0501 [Chryseolinea serpens]|uniref:Metallo-peptidase family M12B Reprolysin-like n=1 Tax=Chryseolinea serpens TaxID=947013 RepID=A0A1M5K937_9BACT|nr:hypothetical protein [Chryseolinea serpens]SHG49100.1 hypothetical protein SAMN04488109_0501 [Chryseolinea serpens]
MTPLISTCCRRLLCSLLLLIPLSGYAQLKPKPTLDYYLRWCYPVVELIPVEIPPIKIPVGCEVVDCCPGCPGPPIDWRINVLGELPVNVLLNAANVPGDIMEKLEMKGVEKKENMLRLSKGESMIRGFPKDTGKRPAVLSLQLELDKGALEKMSAMQGDKADGKTGDAPEVSIEIQVDQYSGDYRVNQFRALYTITWRCRWYPPLGTNDKIDIDANVSNDNAIVLVDARDASSTCLDDAVFRGSDIVGVGNLLTNAPCQSEVSIFSDDNAMEFHENVTTWTNAAGDVHHAPLQPIIVAPVSVWIAQPGGLTRAQNDINRANQLYNVMNSGVIFNPTFTDVSANTQATALITTGFGCSGTEITNLTGSTFFTANRLNVYYANGILAGSNRGFNCNANQNISFIGTSADNESTAHEIGHAFSLGHSNSVSGIPTTNLMITGGTGRNSITIGQAFRINLNPGSRLNANGTRTGGTRTCADGTTSITCPALSFDVTPR